MKTNLITIAHTGRLRAAFREGKRRVAYMHVGTSPRELVRCMVQVFTANKVGARRSFVACKNMSYALRADRRALYLGMVARLRNERRLMSAFNL